mgnify:CR=1 FL=1
MSAQQSAKNRRLAATASGPLPGDVAQGTRRTILEVALTQFAERGYAGTSIRDIAAAIEVKAASLYAHFPSKAHILAELVELGHDEQLRSTQSELLKSDPDPRAQILSYVRGHVAAHATYQMLCIVANAELHMLEGELASPALQKRKFAEQLLNSIVARGIEQDLFHVPHAWLSTAAIGGMGLRVAYWYTPEFDQDIEALSRTYGLFALRLLGVADADDWAG